MAHRLLGLLDRSRRWYLAHRSAPIIRLLRGLATLCVVAACVVFIWRQFASGAATLSKAELRVEPLRVLVSSLCVAAATALGAWEWVLLVRALGFELGTLQGTAIHLKANLTKYVPGFVWQYASQGYLAIQQGVPPTIAGASLVAELLVVFLDGGLLILLCLPYSGVFAWNGAWAASLEALAFLLAVAVVALVPAVGRHRARTSARAPRGAFQDIAWARVAVVIVAVLATWFLLAFGFSLLYTHGWRLDWPRFARHSLALAASLLLGQIAFFAPLGLGVREAVLVGLLATDRSAAAVVILAVLFRLQMLVGEIVCAGVAWALLRRVRHRRRPAKA